MDLYLHNLIYQLIADWRDPAVYYLVYARYFFYDQQMGSYQPVHINKNSVKSIALLTNGIKCKMMLDPDELTNAYSIHIPFDSISKISRIHSMDNESEFVLFRKKEYMDK